MTLSVLAARSDGLDPAYSQEFMLAATARRLHRPVVALESLDQQRRTLQTVDRESIEGVADHMLRQLETGNVRRVLARVGEVWEQGDLAALEAYAEWCDCAQTPRDRQFLHQLNDERNPAMADRIVALHHGGQKVFAGVGAMHMVGPQGLPALLAVRGLRVERLR